MTDTDLSPLEQDDLLAAEYVLGVLPLAERLAAEARMKTDAAFAERVSLWVAHFAPLNEAYASVPVPPDLLTRFESRPAKSGQWEYYFYIDIAGHPSQPQVAAALRELQGLCAFYKVLGAYPVSE